VVEYNYNTTGEPVVTILVKVKHIEDLLDKILTFVQGSIIGIRKKRTLLILTELGNEPLIFKATIPKLDIYDELLQAKYIFIHDGKIKSSNTPPTGVTSGVLFIIDAKEVKVEKEALTELTI